MDKKYYKPVFTLILIVPFLTELLSGNCPPSLFFQPIFFLFFLVVYGLAALIIREISVRWKLGIEGIFIIGLAYGIFNEGVCARTLLLSKTVPIAQAYGNYDLAFGINFAWASLILPWHAFHSVLYPILLVSLIYPGANNLCWLSKKTTVIFTVLFFLVGIAVFFSSSAYRAPVIYLPVFLLAIAGLVFFSRFLPETHFLQSIPDRFWLKYVVFGFLFISFTAGSVILGMLSAPLAVLFLYAVVLIAIFYSIIRLKKWLSLRSLALFILGNYIADAIFLFLAGKTKASLEMQAASLIFILIFITAILKLRRYPAA